MPERPWIEIAVLLTLLAGYVVVHFPHIDDNPYHGEDEIRDAKIVRETMASDTIAVLQLDGVPYPDKPPLYFWTAIAASRITGKVNQMSTRLPSFVAGALLLALVFVTCCRLGGLRAGICAAIVCGTSLCFDEIRVARMNILMTFFVAGATMSLYAAHRTGRLLWALIAGAGMGLAMLTKGPFGYLMPMTTLGAFLLLRGEWRSFPRLRPITVTIVTAAIFLAWYLPASRLGIADHLALSPFDHNQPWYYYFPRIFQVLAPWGLFLIPAIMTYRRMPEGREREHALLFLTWFFSTFVVISLYPPKRLSYLLFLLPSFAALMGWYFSVALRPDVDEWIARWYRIVMRVSALLLATAMTVAVIIVDVYFKEFMPAAVVVAGALAFAFGGVFWLTALKRTWHAFALYTAAVILGWAVAHLLIEPTFIRNYTRTKALPETLPERMDRDQS